MKLNIALVDDEELALMALEDVIVSECHSLNVVGKAYSVEGAKAILNSGVRIDVLFLDIQMPKLSGFDLLDELDTHDILVVFVTAHDQYAIKAIKAGAIDYVLKPFNPEEFEEIEQRILLIKSQQMAGNRIGISNAHLKANLISNRSSDRIGIPEGKSIKFVKVSEILYLNGEGAYTHIIIKDGSNLLASKHLGFFEQVLGEKHFFRIHKSHVINMHHLSEYLALDVGIAVMSNGDQLPVSRRRVKALVNQMRNFV